MLNRCFQFPIVFQILCFGIYLINVTVPFLVITFAITGHTLHHPNKSACWLIHAIDPPSHPSLRVAVEYNNRPQRLYTLK